MTLVDYIDLDYDEYYVKLDVVDLTTDEDSFGKGGNVEEDDANVAQSENVTQAAASPPISVQDATGTTCLLKLEKELGGTTSLSMVEYGAATSSLMAEEAMQPENQVFLATSDVAKEATQSRSHELIAASDCVGKAMQSEHEAEVVVFSSMTEQGGATSLLLTKQGTITSSLSENKAMQSKDQVFVAAVDCTKEATLSESTEKVVVLPSMTEGCATCKCHNVGQLCQMIGCPHIVRDGVDLRISHGGGHSHGEPGSSTVPCTKSDVSIKHEGHSGTRVKIDAGNPMVSTRIYDVHVQEKPEGDTEKDQNRDLGAKVVALYQEVTQDFVAVPLYPEGEDKENSRFGKFYNKINGKKRVNTSSTECNTQFSTVYSKGVQPTAHDGNDGFSVVGSVGNGTGSTVICSLNGEVVMCTYQECSKTSQGSTRYCKVHDSASKGCMVQGCINVAHGGTALCICHGSRVHKRRGCAVSGCTKGACRSSQGRTDRCVKHGGGKRCKYDGCGKGAQGNTDFCIAHGGGRRCKFQGCGNSAQGRTDYCIKHGGGRRCMVLGCNMSAAYGTDFCSMHRRSLLSGYNSAHEMLPAPAPERQAKEAGPSKRRNSHSVTGGERAQKRQNTDEYVNNIRSFSDVEMVEEKGRVLICQNNTLKAQQTAREMNSESGLAA